MLRAETTDEKGSDQMTIEQPTAAPLMEAFAQAKTLIHDQPAERIDPIPDAILMGALLLCATIGDAAAGICKTLREIDKIRYSQAERRHADLMRALTKIAR